MQKLAQSWLVLQISGSPFLLGLDAFLGEIPILLFSLVGGVAADRTDRRHLLLGSQFVQMSNAFLLSGLIATETVKVWHILTLSFVNGFAQAFGGPAYQALIPSLVKAEDMPNAIALNSIQFNLARVTGPVLGGLALTKLGAAWCFGLNGISFIAVIVSLFLLDIRFVPEKTGESMVGTMRKGFGFIRQKEGMVALIALAFTMTMLGIPMMTFLPVFAKDVFHKGASTYTVFLSFSGAGAVCGALMVAAIENTCRMGRIALIQLFMLGTLTTGFALSKSVTASCILLFLAGVMLMAVFSLVTSLVQLITNDEMRGRVMSVYNVAFRGGMPIGNLAVGLLARRFSAPVVLAFNGVLLCALGLYFLFVHRRVADL
jgi:predicted MFS family arabinose efflux permease